MIKYVRHVTLTAIFLQAFVYSDEKEATPQESAGQKKNSADERGSQSEELLGISSNPSSVNIQVGRVRLVDFCLKAPMRLRCE